MRLVVNYSHSNSQVPDEEAGQEGLMVGRVDLERAVRHVAMWGSFTRSIQGACADCGYLPPMLPCQRHGFFFFPAFV